MNAWKSKLCKISIRSINKVIFKGHHINTNGRISFHLTLTTTAQDENTNIITCSNLYLEPEYVREPKSGYQTNM